MKNKEKFNSFGLEHFAFEYENVTYKIGDIVCLTYQKRIGKYFQIIFNEYTLQVDLFNPNNSLSIGDGSCSSVNPINETYLPFFKVMFGLIPFVKIEWIGNDKKSFDLVKRIKNRKSPKYWG